jgi:hypothetical protein
MENDTLVDPASSLMIRVDKLCSNKVLCALGLTDRMTIMTSYKRLISTLLAAAVLMGATGSASAQTEADVISAVRAQVGANRQALVAANLGLTESESEAFWPVYREFHNDRDQIMDRRVKMLTDFRNNFETLTDEQAKTMLSGYFDLQEDLLKLRKKFVKKFEKVLPQKTTLRYFQIENKLDTIIDYDLASVVPLAQ